MPMSHLLRRVVPINPGVQHRDDSRTYLVTYEDRQGRLQQLSMLFTVDTAEREQIAPPEVLRARFGEFLRGFGEVISIQLQVTEMQRFEPADLVAHRERVLAEHNTENKMRHLKLQGFKGLGFAAMSYVSSGAFLMSACFQRLSEGLLA